ncbi:hypothetical protein HC928_24660 [bacterium]|nr:hypothetical protein [bacterium]
MNRKISFRLFLAIPFLLGSLIITILLGYFFYQDEQQEIDNIANLSMKRLNVRVVQKLNKYLQNAHQINRLNIAAVKSGTINLKNLNQLHRYLILQLFETKSVTTVLFGTPQGEFRIVHQVSSDDFGVNTYLRPEELPYEAAISKANAPSINKVYSVNEAGDLVREIETVVNIDVRDRPWYRRAAESGKPGWTKPFQISSTNLLGINAYTPLYNSREQLQGVFSVNLSLHQIEDFLETQLADEDGEVFIIERNGFLIANSFNEPSYVTSKFIFDLSQKNPVTQPEKIQFQRLSVYRSSNPRMRETLAI